jgi:hypothetical protein
MRKTYRSVEPFRKIDASKRRLATIDRIAEVIFDKTGHIPSDADLAVTLATSVTAIRRAREKGCVR